MKSNVYESIEKIKKLHEQEITDTAAMLSDAIDEKAKQEAKAAAALESGKVEDYTSARALVREAEDRVEYYTSKLNKIKASPYFSKEEKAEKVAAIQADVEEMRRDCFRKIFHSAMECVDLMNDLMDRMAKANDAFKVLEFNDKGSIGKYNILHLASIRNRLDVRNIESMKEYCK